MNVNTARAERTPLNVNATPVERVPITTQHMWEVAAEDFERDERMLDLARAQPDVTPEIITRRERRLRIRRAICNAIDFLITNQADVSAVIAQRKGRDR